MGKLRYLYLHGFASSPRSKKAAYFRDRFAEAGLRLEVPQLDRGDFEHLTISGQLQLIGELAGGRPTVLIGSSLGGYLAALYAARHPEVQRVVLMAPAFRFPTHFPGRLEPGRFEDWKLTGRLQVFHYGAGADRDLWYGFYEDGRQYEAEPEVRQPALIIHGTRDDVVPHEFSVAYASHLPNVELHLVGSGHELTDQLGQVWALSAQFLHLQRRVG